MKHLPLCLILAVTAVFIPQPAAALSLDTAAEVVDATIVQVLDAAPIADAVLTQATIEAQPSVAEKAIDWLLSPGGIAVAVMAIGGALSLLLGSSAVRKRRVALGIYHAFQIVNDVDHERGDTKLDKPKEGLRALNEWMIAQGWRPLKPGEEKLAELGFKALHGEEIQRAKVAAKAQALAGAGAAVPS